MEIVIFKTDKRDRHIHEKLKTLSFKSVQQKNIVVKK